MYDLFSLANGRHFGGCIAKFAALRAAPVGGRLSAAVRARGKTIQWLSPTGLFLEGAITRAWEQRKVPFRAKRALPRSPPINSGLKASAILSSRNLNREPSQHVLVPRPAKGAFSSVSKIDAKRIPLLKASLRLDRIWSARPNRGLRECDMYIWECENRPSRPSVSPLPSIAVRGEALRHEAGAKNRLDQASGSAASRDRGAPQSAKEGRLKPSGEENRHGGETNDSS